MYKKNNRDPFKDLKLDKEEQLIEEELAKGQYVSARNLKKRKELFMKAVKEFRELRRTKPITIRVNTADLIKVKVKAKENKIPYQTLLSVLIGKYADGKTKIEL